jgi:zinc transport system permease protein
VAALALFRGFRAVVLASTVFGVVMTVGGLALSYAFDLPSGPAMVLLGAAALLVVAAGRRLGDLRRRAAA